LNAVDTAIFTKLSADSDILAKLGSAQIYKLKIPQKEDVTYPAIRFFYAGGGDENLTPTDSLNIVYAVVGVSNVSAKDAGEVADLIHTCLHKQTLTISGWPNQFWTAGEGKIDYYELDEKAGTDYWHAGAYYRIRASAS